MTSFGGFWGASLLWGVFWGVMGAHEMGGSLGSMTTTNQSYRRTSSPLFSLQ